MLKMKQLFYIISGFSILFASCESKTITLNTNVEKEIEIQVNESDTSALKSGAESYYFEKIDTIQFEDYSDLEDNKSRIESILFNKVDCELIGIPDSCTIEYITVATLDPLVSATASDITSNDTLSLKFELDFFIDSLNDAALKFLSNEKMAVKVSGKSSYAPFLMTAKLNFDTDIDVKIEDKKDDQMNN